ncbi:MAG TPA: hypothetical protein VFO79_17315, partial [Xanthomonadales bacterium]|nr:hypothetical protein [Xanthomonadales bacterium]
MRRGLVLAALLPFAAAAQELADERAAAAYAAWTDDTAARLAARGTVHDALVAILFEQAAAKGGRSRAPERLEQAWIRASADGSANPLVHWLALTDCPRGREACDRRVALDALLRLEPDNGAAWQLALDDALAKQDRVGARAALAALARAERFDTHHDEYFRLVDTALADVPVPASVRTLGEASIDEDGARGIALLGVMIALPTLDASGLRRYCTPGVEASYEERRADCAAAGERIATRSETSLERFTGARVWLDAVRGGPDEARARQALVDLHWQAERFHEQSAGEDTGPVQLAAQL